MRVEEPKFPLPRLSGVFASRYRVARDRDAEWAGTEGRCPPKVLLRADQNPPWVTRWRPVESSKTWSLAHWVT